MMALTGGRGGELRAPTAVRVLDLDRPLGDLEVVHTSPGEDYRSLLAVVRVAEEPVGVATFLLDGGGCVTHSKLAHGLREQLGSELCEAFARHDSRRRADARSGVPPHRRNPGASLAPSVSVVVPTCSNPGPLERCLRSVLECDYPDFEVIVVENRPARAGTAAMLLDRFPDERRVRYVEEPRPSASLARNAGLASSEGEIVAFTDDDVVVDRLWLRASVAALLSAPAVACVTGLILPLDLDSEAQLLLEQFAGFGKGFHGRTYRLPQSLAENPLLPYAAGALGSGASIVMRTQVARELGGFDPALGPATPAKGGEDLDLLVAVLRRGHALSYEPKAIVWHEHPDGAARLRRQVYGYGVGLGAMLGKQLLAGPQRRDLMRAVPAGVRYLRDPASRKNVGKPSGFPRHLTWLERVGMLLGPVLYLISALVVQARRLVPKPQRTPRPLRIVRRLAVGGAPPVSVSLFKEVAGAPRRLDARAAVEREQSGPSDAMLLGGAVICIAAPAAVWLGAPTALRLPLVLALLCVAPGVAWMAAVGGQPEPGLVIGISLAASTVTAQTMLWFGAWWPRLVLTGFAVVCLTLGVRRAASLRRARARLPGARLLDVRIGVPAVRHAALICAALLAWAASLASADLNRIDGVGLLAALPPTYPLAIALLLAGFIFAVSSAHAGPLVCGAYVVALIVVLDATTAVLYAEPRYAWTYPHLGVINLLASSGHANREIDIYTNWPSFFGLGAWLTRTSGVAAIRYAGWAQVFFNLFNVLALRFALRGLTRDERILWTAALLFVLGNWVGQDYLAPQALGFALGLVVLGLCLRCGKPIAEPRIGMGGRSGSLLRRIIGWGFPRPPRDDQRAPSPISRRTAVAIGGLCYLAIVTSHQLSPVMLVLGALLLSVSTRKVPLWIPAAMGVLELWWMLMAWSFLHAHFHVIDPGGTGASAPGRSLDAALSGAAVSFYAPAAVMALITALALVGVSRRIARGKRDVVPVCLIAAPVAVVAVQSYGGEGGYRAYLFALPWLCFLGAFAASARQPADRGERISRWRLFAIALPLAGCLLFAFFGQELANHVPRADVAAATWYERTAPAGAMRVNLAPDAPSRLTARYPLVDLSDPSPLVTVAGFTGHRPGAGDVRRLTGLILAQRARPAYVFVSRLQENYARLNGLLPPGSLQSLVAALGRSSAFSLVFHRPAVWIFEYHEPRAAEPAMRTGGLR